MKILVFSPWPPQHTGIADYAYDLVSGLCDHGVEVTVVTECDTPERLTGVYIVSPEWCEGQDLSEYDRIIYQVGNNSSFHIFMLPYLLCHGGVVHLHDMVLHHIMAFMLYLHGNSKRYWQVLNKWYGPAIVDFALELMSHGTTLWDSDYVAEIPLFEEVLQYADSCVVHSEFARTKINKVFPNLDCFVIPQVYKVGALPKSDQQSKKKFSIGIFGGVDPNKRLDIVLDALSECWEFKDRIELHIVGTIHKDCLHYSEVVEQKGLKDVVHFHGRVSEQFFIETLARMDLCISLRFPTMGETSAVVMRALQYGVPVVVNDIGWYAELPDFVFKLKPESDQESSKLANYIRKLIIDSKDYESLKSNVEAYSKNNLNFTLVVKDYLEQVTA